MLRFSVIAFRLIIPHTLSAVRDAVVMLWIQLTGRYVFPEPGPHELKFIRQNWPAIGLTGSLVYVAGKHWKPKARDDAAIKALG